jgi:hypothetical protein
MFEFICLGNIYDKPEMRLVRGVCYCMSAGLSYFFNLICIQLFVVFCGLNKLPLYSFHV